MAFKQLSIPLWDIKRNPSEGVLSFCKSPTLFSELFGEPKVLLKKCQIQEEQEDHIHGRKRTIRNLKSEDYELGSESSEHTSHEEEEDHIHSRKRTIRNLKSEECELGSESSEHTSSHEEEEVHNHYSKKEFRNGICLKNKKHASKRSKVSVQESAPISDYQKMIAERNKEQLALLRSVGVIQEEQEDDRKRSLRNLKSVKYAENQSDNSTSDEDYELESKNSGHAPSDEDFEVESRSSGHTSSDEEEKGRSRYKKKSHDEKEVHSHYKKKEYRKKKSHKNKKQASKRSKVSERKKNEKQASKRSKVKFAENESDYSTSDDSTSEESFSLSSSPPENSEVESRSSGRASSDEVCELDSENSGHTSSDEEEKGRSRYKKKSHSVPLSDYEKMIAEKNKERLALLSSLGVMEAKDDFCGILSNLKPKPVKKVKKVQWPIEQERCSQRLAKQTRSIDYNEEAMYELFIEKQKKKNNKPLEMSFKTVLKYPEMYENYLEDFNLQNPIAECVDVHYDENVLKKLTLDECNFIAVVPNPTVLAWYPSSEDLILAAGDNYGCLGIYKLGPESSPYLFKPHNARITNLLFNPLNCIHMVSSSNDGSVYCADLVKHAFTKIYDASSTVSHSYFDFLSLTTCLVAQNSSVALIDYRTDRITGEMSHRCHKNIVNTVHVHPVHKYNFVTAGRDKLIHLWDLRMLRDNSPTTYHVHYSPVQCAYFSPGTGDFILSASALDISIIESQDMTQSIDMKMEFGMGALSTHRNRNPRANKRGTVHLRNAKWLPDSQSLFIVNHMLSKSSIEVYVKGRDVCHKIQQEDLRVKGLSTFHPCKPVLAGVTAKDYFFFFSYKS